MKDRYGFSGKVFRFGRYYGTVTAEDNIVTAAKTRKEARRNIDYKLKDLFGLTRDAKIEFDDSSIFYIPRDEDVETCSQCGTPLTDSGRCPVCDDGEEDY